MNPFFPVYTEQAECQDCYKCVRECPVKAIQVKDSSASIIEDRCIMCGHCVNICPVGAKRVRSDLGRVKKLLQLKKRTLVSIAPSFRSEFPEIDSGQMIRALKMLGFHGVSETALGAEEVSAHVAESVVSMNNNVMISSACPTVVKYLKKYQPEAGAVISPFLSPVLAHAKLLRKEYGDDIAIVFIGPCIAKKIESDEHPDLLNLVLTFKELEAWLEESAIDPITLKPEADDVFIPEAAREGGLYPVDGGMIAGIQKNCPVHDASFMTFSGMTEIQKSVQDIQRIESDKPVFIELLACKGGCINGPQSSSQKATISKRLNIINQVDYPKDNIPHKSKIDITHIDQIQPIKEKSFSDPQIQQALVEIGKYTAKDELNCGGCGYDNCKEFAAAMLSGKAEKTMCVSYMRKLAQKKANALLNAMPSGVVMVNADLKIVECNFNFARLIGNNAELVYKASPGLEGAALKKLISFSHLFEKVLQTGEDILDKDIHEAETILHTSIFSIERHRLIGCIIQDITTPAIHKEQIIKRTKQVIEKNMETVQQIAYLLGENASETQVMLDSIVHLYGNKEAES